MTEQETIDRELQDLMDMARLNNMDDPEFRVGRSEAGTFIAMVSVGGLQTIWNEVPEGTNQIEYRDGHFVFNMNIVCVAPDYITIILPDGTIKRGREMPTHQRKEMEQELSNFYARHREAQTVKMLREMFPPKAKPIPFRSNVSTPVSAELLPKGSAADWSQMPYYGLDQLINTGYHDKFD